MSQVIKTAVLMKESKSSNLSRTIVHFSSANEGKHKPGGIFFFREASFYLNAVHLVLKHPIAQGYLQQTRAHTHYGL